MVVSMAVLLWWLLPIGNWALLITTAGVVHGSPPGQELVCKRNEKYSQIAGASLRWHFV